MAFFHSSIPYHTHCLVYRYDSYSTLKAFRIIDTIDELYSWSCFVIDLWWHAGCRTQLMDLVDLTPWPLRAPTSVPIHWIQFWLTMMMLRSCNTLWRVAHQLFLWVKKNQTSGFILIYFISWPAINAVTESRPRPRISSLQHTHTHAHTEQWLELLFWDIEAWTFFFF